VFSRDFSRETFLLSMVDQGQREKRGLIENIHKPNDGSGQVRIQSQLRRDKAGK
jgi:hypothetical protein